MKRTFPLLALLLASALAFPAHSSAASVVGLWKMDETSGQVATDSSGYHNDGALKDVTLEGDAYSFNGSSSRVLVPSDGSLNPGAGDISITVEVNFPSIHIHDYDLLRKGGDGQLYKIEIARTGKARCQFHGTDRDDGLVFGPNLADGQWHTITCTKTASRISGTVDGHTATHAATIGSISNGTALSFGGKSSGTQDLYRGLMRNVSIAIG